MSSSFIFLFIFAVKITDVWVYVNMCVREEAFIYSSTIEKLAQFHHAHGEVWLTIQVNMRVPSTQHKKSNRKKKKLIKYRANYKFLRIFWNDDMQPARHACPACCLQRAENAISIYIRQHAWHLSRVGCILQNPRRLATLSSTPFYVDFIRSKIISIKASKSMSTKKM